MTEVGSVEPQVKVDVKSVLSGKVVADGSRGRQGAERPGHRLVEPDPSQASRSRPR